MHYLRVVSMPLFFAVLFGSLFIIWAILDLPPPEELAATVEKLFDRYGLPILFVSSFIEGALLVGGYFPGVFVIFLSVILASSIGEAMLAVAVVTAGLYMAHMFNYALGRYGWYRLLVQFGLRGAIERTQRRLVEKGPVIIFSSYWLPSLGALTDTAAGILRMPFRTFAMYSFIATALWDTAVGAVVYSFKDTALSVATPGSSGAAIIFAVIALWALLLVVRDVRSKRALLSSPESSSEF